MRRAGGMSIYIFGRGRHRKENIYVKDYDITDICLESIDKSHSIII
jgi:hypothetical protein